MNLKNLINQLPFYFKEADTYKNSNGEGLLERYLQIFGKYLEDDLKPSIESMREYVSVGLFNNNDNRNDYSVVCQSLRGVFSQDYFWDFLGQMPYARFLKEPIRNIEAKSLDLASGNTYKPFISKYITKYDLGFIKGDLIDVQTLLSILDKVPGTIEGSLIDTNKVASESIFALLVYSVPLYKIRGTEKFFKIYFEMLDLDVSVSNISDSITSSYNDTLNDKTEVQVNGSDQVFNTKEASSVRGLMDAITKLDQGDNILDGSNLDAHPSCQKCKTVNVVMDITKSNYTQDEFWALHSKVLSIFDRFLPINVKANITYSNNDLNKAYLITDPIIHIYIWDGKDWIISSNSNEWVKNNYIDINRKEVKIKVVITDTTIRGSHTKYHFEVADNSTYSLTNKSETIHDSGDVITITKAGTYYIRVCENKMVYLGNNSGMVPVINGFTIRETALVINPSITYKLLNQDYQEVKGFKIPSEGTSYLYIRVYSYVNNEWANFTIEKPDGTWEDVMEYDDIDDEGRYYYDYYIERKGVYKISLISYPTVYTKLDVGMEDDEYANCTLDHDDNTELSKEGDSIPVAIHACLDYISRIERIALCASSTSTGYIILNSKHLDSLYSDIKPSTPYGITSKSSISTLASFGYIHCYLKLDTSAWTAVTTVRYIQLRNVPYDDKNSFIGIYNNSTKTLTKLPIKWRPEVIEVTTPYGTYKVKNSVPYNISGYLRNNNNNFLEILSTCTGWVVEDVKPNKYYRDGDIIRLNQVGEYYFSGAIPLFDEKHEDYDYGSDDLEITQNIVDIGPLNYILSPQGTFFYPVQEKTGLPDAKDVIKFTLTCVTNLSWSTGRAYKNKNLIPITGIIQQYKSGDKGLMWYNVFNPDIFTETIGDDKHFSTYTLKYEYTLNYGTYNTYPTRIKLGGLIEQYIDIHLGIFIDPNKNYLYLQPVDPLDGGWSKPNWGSADLSTPSNTPDRIEYDLMANKLEFTIQQTLIDNNNKSGGVNGGMAKLYTVDDNGNETYTGQSYIIGTEVISNIKTTGKYRLRGEGDYSANYIEINVISSGTFKIACDPPVAALSAEGYATTRVTATCDTPNTPAYQLQVQRDGESVWHDVPYDFVANSLGVYHFIVRGNTTVGTTFSVVSKLTVSTNKSQLTWAADNTDIQEVELTADSNLQWSIEVSDD